MIETHLRIKPEDLDEASIFFYRIWASAVLGEEPEALVLLEPEYIVIAQDWVLYCNRVCADNKQLSLIASDTRRPIICISRNLDRCQTGLDIERGSFFGPDQYKPIVEVFVRAATELPPASRGRDPQRGRWVRKSYGRFEIWHGRQARLICIDTSGEEFGYTWDSAQTDIYFYRSKSCKRDGRKLVTGHFKCSEQKRDQGVSHQNIDLLSEDKNQAALIHLTPAGAGYKVFTRQLPRSFEPIYHFYKE